MQEKQYSLRNKTIRLSDEEINLYSSRSISSVCDMSIGEITDKTIFADIFDAAKRLPSSFADLLIVDPPYNLTKKFGDTTFRKTSYEEYIAFTREWLKAILHTLKPGASVYVCSDWQCSNAVSSALEELFTVRNRITWQREKGRGCLTNWKNASEDIWFATLGNEYRFHPERVKLRRKVIAPYKENGIPKDWEETENGSFRDTYPSNFWDDISIPFWSMPENTEHPTQKPEKLIAKLILASSNEGDTVFDPFMGSGTVPVTAKKLGRHYVGVEKEKKYCAFAEKRLELADMDKNIQGFSGGVFWERNTHSEIKNDKA